MTESAPLPKVRPASSWRTTPANARRDDVSESSTESSTSSPPLKPDNDLSDAEHGAQVRERLARYKGWPGLAQADLFIYAPVDLARLLDRAERAERERDGWRDTAEMIRDLARNHLARAEQAERERMPEYHTPCARCGDPILDLSPLAAWLGRGEAEIHRLELCPKCDHESRQEIR